MAHDKAYYQAENKIEQALKSGAAEFIVRHPFKSASPLQSPLTTSAGNKGGKYDIFS